ncbi:hypothetical protein [Lacticaseibacillus camelliae]|nr:hypothetical protein [Lacticaseibacillus camelliae]
MAHFFQSLFKGIANFFTLLAGTLNRPFLPPDSARKRVPRQDEDDWRHR